jgi:hypothetical protein
MRYSNLDVKRSIRNLECGADILSNFRPRNCEHLPIQLLSCGTRSLYISDSEPTPIEVMAGLLKKPFKLALVQLASGRW